jgi:hypothetical protein
VIVVVVNLDKGDNAAMGTEMEKTKKHHRIIIMKLVMVKYG